MNTLTTLAAITTAIAATAAGFTAMREAPAGAPAEPVVHHRTVRIDDLDIFYREAGDAAKPTILLLHGFPTSSQMFRNLMPALADSYHLVAPDYPGFGNSSMPTVDEFEYTFDHLADVVEAFTEKLGLDRYALYLMDYGAPVGFRLATRHPERVTALLVQNGNAYEEGLGEFWAPLRRFWSDRSEANAQPLRGLLTLDATKWQYTHGVRDVTVISPDTWNLDQRFLDREGNVAIQLQLFHDYGSNPPLYPAWQAWLREHRPPTLVTWGKNDQIFIAAGAAPYRRDLPDAEIHMLDTGHFALEEDGARIAARIRDFLGRSLPR